MRVCTYIFVYIYAYIYICDFEIALHHEIAALCRLVFFSSNYTQRMRYSAMQRRRGERERMCVCVCMCVYVRERAREGVCVCVRERERASERERARARARERERERFGNATAAMLLPKERLGNAFGNLYLMQNSICEARDKDPH